MDEGSFEPDPTLNRVRQIADETLKIAHSMNLVKTKTEAENDPGSDEEN